MKQLTREQAIQMAESKVYENWDSEKITRFQLFQSKLCMPFSTFHKAISEVLGRPVFVHEFADPDSIKEEYLGSRQAPTLEEIIEQIPEGKRLLI